MSARLFKWRTADTSTKQLSREFADLDNSDDVMGKTTSPFSIWKSTELNGALTANPCGRPDMDSLLLKAKS